MSIVLGIRYEPYTIDYNGHPQNTYGEGLEGPDADGWIVHIYLDEGDNHFDVIENRFADMETAYAYACEMGERHQIKIGWC